LPGNFFAMLFLSVALMAVSLISPVGYAPLGLEPQAGGEVSAPWLVVWLQMLLRYFPPLLAGIFFPLLILALITFLPWLPRAGEEIPRRPYYWGIHQIAFWVLGGLSRSSPFGACKPSRVSISFLAFVILQEVTHIPGVPGRHPGDRFLPQKAAARSNGAL